MKKSNSYKLLESLITYTPQETADFGYRLAQQLRPRDVIALYGSLGSGKTTCIRGICSGLMVTEIVTSPTFTLINEYRGRLPVFHFDFYRIQNEEELLDLGIPEYFDDDGVCLIEWPEIIEHWLPPHTWRIRLFHAYEKEILPTFNPKANSGAKSEPIEKTAVAVAGDSVQKPMMPSLPGDDGLSAQRLIQVYGYDRAGD